MSIVLAALSMWIWTSFCWPILFTRSSACRFELGFHQSLRNITLFAFVNVSPSEPILELSSKTLISEFLENNSKILKSSCIKKAVVEHSFNLIPFGETC